MRVGEESNRGTKFAFRSSAVPYRSLIRIFRESKLDKMLQYDEGRVKRRELRGRQREGGEKGKREGGERREGKY
jgi:hypothetical protein